MLISALEGRGTTQQKPKKGDDLSAVAKVIMYDS